MCFDGLSRTQVNYFVLFYFKHEKSCLLNKTVKIKRLTLKLRNYRVSFKNLKEFFFGSNIQFLKCSLSHSESFLIMKKFTNHIFVKLETTNARKNYNKLDFLVLACRIDIYWGVH